VYELCVDLHGMFTKLMIEKNIMLTMASKSEKCFCYIIS